MRSRSLLSGVGSTAGGGVERDSKSATTFSLPGVNCNVKLYW